MPVFIRALFSGTEGAGFLITTAFPSLLMTGVLLSNVCTNEGFACGFGFVLFLRDVSERMAQGRFKLAQSYVANYWS